MSRGDVADACRDQVLHLLQDGLFESAEVLCHFVLSSAPWPRADREALGASFEELLADSLFAQSQFKRAAMHFQQALDLSGCGRGRPVESKDEARLIYKSALCSIELKEASCGIKLLESIPPALRNVKVCVAMGKLYAELGLKKSAIGCFRQVLSVLPSSIEAIESLVVLGLDSGEIADIAMKGSLKSIALSDFMKPWLSKLIAALELKCKCRHSAAFNAFAELNGILPHNIYLLTNAGISAAGSREHGDELSVLNFKSARSLDRFATRGMDVYSSVLQRSGDSRELAQLSQELVTLNRAAGSDFGGVGVLSGEPRSPCCEGWVAAAMHAEVKGEADRALEFINKAIQVKPHNAVALKLKGNMLLVRERPEEAVVVFLQSNAIIKDVQCYEGITSVYLSLGRVNDAVLAAKECVLHMQQSAEAFSLMGSVLARTAEGKSGALKCYMRALKIDPNNDAAVEALATLFSQLDNPNEAIKHLQNFVKRKPSPALLIQLAKLMNTFSGVPLASIEYLNEAIHLAAPGSRFHTEIAEEFDATERLLKGDYVLNEEDEQMNVSDEGTN